MQTFRLFTADARRFRPTAGDRQSSAPPPTPGPRLSSVSAMPNSPAVERHRPVRHLQASQERCGTTNSRHPPARREATLRREPGRLPALNSALHQSESVIELSNASNPCHPEPNQCLRGVMTAVQ